MDRPRSYPAGWSSLKEKPRPLSPVRIVNTATSHCAPTPACVVPPHYLPLHAPMVAGGACQQDSSGCGMYMEISYGVPALHSLRTSSLPRAYLYGVACVEMGGNHTSSLQYLQHTIARCSPAAGSHQPRIFRRALCLLFPVAQGCVSSVPFFFCLKNCILVQLLGFLSFRRRPTPSTPGIVSVTSLTRLQRCTRSYWMVNRIHRRIERIYSTAGIRSFHADNLSVCFHSSRRISRSTQAEHPTDLIA
jgi:hypothetical protein